MQMTCVPRWGGHDHWFNVLGMHNCWFNVLGMHNRWFNMLGMHGLGRCNPGVVRGFGASGEGHYEGGSSQFVAVVAIPLLC